MSAPNLVPPGTTGGGAPVGGSGTIGTIPKWDTASTLGDSAVTQTAGAIATVTLTAGGAGYTNGTYAAKALTGGAGTGATADFVVAAGIVTVCGLRAPGVGYLAADVLSCATIGAGAGLIVSVATVVAAVSTPGNVTANRLGAGTTNPRAALDVVGGVGLFTGSELYNTITPFSGPRFWTSLAISPNFALTSTNIVYSLLVNPVMDLTTAGTTVVAQGLMPLISATNAGSALAITASTALVYRYSANDLSTSVNTGATGYQVNMGVLAGVGSTSTSDFFGFRANSFISAVGHTITRFSCFSAGALLFNSASTITNFYGVRLEAFTGTGTITNRWGVSQEDALAKNYFAGNVLIGNTAAVSGAKLEVTGAISATTTIATGGYTVATLPAGAVGRRAYVTDALAPTYLGALVGGGAVNAPVFHNGTAWVSA